MATTSSSAQNLATGNSPGQRAWKRFRRSKLAIIGLIVVVTMAILAIAAPIVAQQDPLKNDLLNRAKPPTAEQERRQGSRQFVVEAGSRARKTRTAARRREGGDQCSYLGSRRQQIRS